MLLKGDHLINFPIPSIMLGTVVKQRGMQELSHPGHSQSQRSMNTDLLASCLLGENSGGRTRWPLIGECEQKFMAEDKIEDGPRITTS